MGRLLFNCIGFLTALLLPAFALADVYTFVFTQGGSPVSAVKIHGTLGVDNLPARFTNSSGLWVLDTTDLDAREFPYSLPGDKKPYITFTKDNVRFDPPAVDLPDDCPSFRCSIEVIAGKGEQAVLRWKALSPALQALSGVPFTAPFSLDAGQRTTDNSGMVIFPVLRQTACSNSDSNLDNNYTGVFPLDRAGLTCTFATTNSLKQLACPTTSESESTNLVTCSSASEVAVGNSVSYEIRVKNEANSNVPGVTFHGPQLGNLWDTATGFDGKWTFTTSALGVPANTPITLIPTGNRTFSHDRFVVSPNSCPRNVCTIYAVNDGGKQGVLKLRTTKDGTGLSDVSIESSVQGRGTGSILSLTDSLGYSYIPTSILTSCNAHDASDRNDPLAFSPSRTQCSFSDSSATPFSLCPSTSVSDYTIAAACGTPGPSQLVVSGLVSDISGRPLEGARVVAGNLGAIETDRSGKYSLYFDEGTTPGISIEMAPRIFDPAIISFDSIDAAHTGVDFKMVAPSLGKPLPAPTPPCSVQPTYTISGTVYDKSGNPLSGVDILSNDVVVTTSNANGVYSFSAPAALPQWVTASHHFDGFDPAGVAFPIMICNEALVDFLVSDDGSLVVGGNVVDRNFNPVPDVAIEIAVGDATIRATTWSNGQYRAVVPADEDYTVRATFFDELFAPTEYSVTAGVPRLDLDFIAAGQIIPTPTPTPTPSHTPTLTMTPTASPSATMTPLPTFSPTPTISSAPTQTPVPTISPTSTPTPTTTALPTSTATPTATKSPTGVPSPTATSTSIPTPAPTASALPSPSGTTTPTAQPTPTASVPLPTVTPSSAPTPTASPKPSPSTSPVPSPSFPGKDPICHDDKGVKQTIWVGISSVPYFLKDGDKKEDCGDDKPDPKVAVCHRTGDGSSHTIIISANAVDAHLNHGDYIGECGQPTPTPYPEDPTPSPTKSPTASPTGSPGPSASPTATPVLKLRLTSMCSINPQQLLRWRVTNPFSYEVSVMWQLYGTSYYGYLTVPSQSYGYFYTTTVSNSPNTTRLIWNGAQVDVKAAGFSQCDIENPTPTPTATVAPTSAPTETPTPSPTTKPTTSPTASPTSTVPPEDENPAPTSSPEPSPSATPSPDPTPTVTSTSTPEPTPTVKYAYIAGEIRGRNGQAIKGALARKLAAGYRIIGRSTSSSYTFMSPSDGQATWRVALPLGTYWVTVEFLDSSLTIASRPVKFKVRLSSEGEFQSGYLFAAKGRKVALPTSSTARAAKRRARI